MGKLTIPGAFTQNANPDGTQKPAVPSNVHVANKVLKPLPKTSESNANDASEKSPGDKKGSLRMTAPIMTGNKEPAKKWPTVGGGASGSSSSAERFGSTSSVPGSFSPAKRLSVGSTSSPAGRGNGKNNGSGAPSSSGGGAAPSHFASTSPEKGAGGGDDKFRELFNAFFECGDVLGVLSTFKAFQEECLRKLGGEDAVKGLTHLERLIKATEDTSMSFRMKKVITEMGPLMKRRHAKKLENPDLRVVVSGAGPVGLFFALEAFMMGFRDVTVIEKRDTFSRHNILTLWNSTAELISMFQAREFFPLFTHRDKIPHLGTRELQLVLLKCGLLAGVKCLYGWETVLLEAPAAPTKDTGIGGWSVGLRKPTGRAEPTGVLDLKANKFENAVARAADGACGMIEQNDFDPTFAVVNGGAGSVKLEKQVPVDAFVLAEGETSQNSKRIGFTKKIQKFSRAIAIVLNLWRDPKDKAQNQIKDFIVQGHLQSPAASALKAQGIDFEFMEYLRGTTHYVAICVTKQTLLKKKVCKEDLGGKAFIGRDNISEDALFALGREIATAIGLPKTVEFCDFHGAKLFDFGSRSSLPLPFRVLCEGTAGEAKGRILALDWAAEPKLAFVETNFLEKTIAWLERTVRERKHSLEFVSDMQKNREITTIGKFSDEVGDLKKQLKDFKKQVEISQTAKAEKLLPVFPIGDCLMEPFWPQGTGINRGFHTAYDAAYALKEMCNEGLSAGLLACDFCYRQRSTLLENNQLQFKTEGWNAEPWDRYTGLDTILMMYTQSDAELAAAKKAAIDLDEATRLKCIENPWPVIEKWVGKPGPLQKFVLTDITPYDDREKIEVAFKDAIYIPRPTKMFGSSCCPKGIEAKVVKSALKKEVKSACKGL
ncbi:unnamed protein product [Amoebophrya sp. A25]|nr:unnamed protein product [Amoebophrya sp. A25]|eukprot:GSA25T00015240001.1